MSCFLKGFDGDNFERTYFSYGFGNRDFINASEVSREKLEEADKEILLLRHVSSNLRNF